MQVGIDSFAAAFDENSRALNPADRLRQLVEQIEHADAVGLDAFGIGEQSRPASIKRILIAGLLVLLSYR